MPDRRRLGMPGVQILDLRLVTCVEREIVGGVGSVSHSDGEAQRLAGQEVGIKLVAVLPPVLEHELRRVLDDVAVRKPDLTAVGERFRQLLERNVDDLVPPGVVLIPMGHGVDLLFCA